MLPAARSLDKALRFTAIAAAVFIFGCAKKPAALTPPPTANLGAYVHAGVPNTIAGLQTQINELIRVGKLHDQSTWQIALETFALRDPGTWFETNFAPHHVAQLSQDYPKVRHGHLGHIT